MNCSGGLKQIIIAFAKQGYIAIQKLAELNNAVLQNRETIECIQFITCATLQRTEGEKNIYYCTAVDAAFPPDAFPAHLCRALPAAFSETRH